LREGRADYGTKLEDIADYERIKNIVKNGNYTGISRVQDLTLEMLSGDSSGETEATTEN